MINPLNSGELRTGLNLKQKSQGGPRDSGSTDLNIPRINGETVTCLPVYANCGGWVGVYMCMFPWNTSWDIWPSTLIHLLYYNHCQLWGWCNRLLALGKDLLENQQRHLNEAQEEISMEKFSPKSLEVTISRKNIVHHNLSNYLLFYKKCLRTFRKLLLIG